MTTSARIFRVFVSSTFSDMAAERNALQKHVYPRLREFCASKGARFQAIDLRWGISEEAGLNQRATAVCLNEIARCQRMTKRPDFLLLMGDRYGWQPLPETIPADDWDVLYPRIQDNNSPKLIEQWYVRDDNAVPPAYVLQPRTGEFAEQDAWNKVEQTLREGLHRALEGLDWSREKRLRYETSVTEQEIEAGVLQYEHAVERAICFFRNVPGLPADAKGYAEPDEDARHKLSRLKERLADHLPQESIHSYSGTWRAKKRIISIAGAEFCKAVEAALKQAIEAELATFEDIPALELEQEAHHTFLTEHTRHFVGRMDALSWVENCLSSRFEPVTLTPSPIAKRSLLDRLSGKKGKNIQDETQARLLTSNPPLLLYGSSGIGKSTVIARAIVQTQEMYPQAEIFYRFIGITPASSNILSLLVNLCQTITERYSKDGDTPQDYEALLESLPEYLALASAKQPLIIFLDALDQLQDTYTPSDLRWLPEYLPPHVKVIMSTTPGIYLDNLKHQLPSNALFEIEPLESAFAETLLDKWLSDVHRTLQTDQRAEVLDKFIQNGLPLYLKLALEEAKLWTSYRHNCTLKPTVFELLRDNLFTRLSDQAEHGAMLVSHSLSYLAAARHGLSEDEILDILAQDTEFWDDFYTKSYHQQALDAMSDKQLPVVVWSRLYFDLAPYLIEREVDGASLLAFYHRQFSQAVDMLYLNDCRAARHAQLAHYFTDQPLSMNGVPNARKLSEQAYQQAKANLHDAYVATLTNYSFLQASLDVRSIQALLDDCELMKDDAVHLIGSALSMSAHVLVVDKTSLPDQLRARLSPYYGTEVLDNFLKELADACGKIRPVNLCLIQAGWGLLRVLKGHTDGVSGALALPDGRILSRSFDHTLRLWNSQGAPLAVLRGHTTGVAGMLALPDGRFLSWASYDPAGTEDQTLWLWNSQGAPLAVLRGHMHRPEGALALPDGRFLSWAGNHVAFPRQDHTLRLWSSQGAPLAVLRGHTGGVLGALALTDGRFLSWARDWTLRLWSGQGAPLAVLRGHTYEVRGALALSDGRFLSWAGDEYLSLNPRKDHTLRLWDSQGTPLTVLEGHTDEVVGVLVLSDGRFLSWADDMTLRLWDNQGTPLAVLQGHTDRVEGALELSDGHILSWARSADPLGPKDPALRLWDNQGTPLAVLQGHTRGVLGVLELSDGRFLSWAGDWTLRMWDSKGTPQAVFQGHAGGVRGALVLADGRFLSWGLDHTLRLWSSQGVHLTMLESHTNEVVGVLALADGRFLSWSKDHTLRLWDSKGTPLAVLQGHTNEVGGAFALSDGRFLSWAGEKYVSLNPQKDYTLRLWDSKGTPLAVLQGHTDRVNGALALPDGRFLSWSDDKTLRLWNSQGTPLTVLQGHTDTVTGALPLADERFLSWSASVNPLGTKDATLRLWSSQGAPLAILKGHKGGWLKTDGVEGALALSDGRLLSWGDDKTLRLWDSQGTPLVVLKDHRERIEGALALPDGRFLSWGLDHTLRLWSSQGAPLGVLRGHSYGPAGALALSDGRFLSWAGDATLRLWSSQGAPLGVLRGHTGYVLGALALLDGRFLSWARDDTLRLWDGQGQLIGTFYTDSPITCCDVRESDQRLVVGDNRGHVMVFQLME